MNYLRRVRNVTCVMFAFVMIAAWPGVLQAYPEDRYCTGPPPLSKVWLHDHDYEGVQPECLPEDESMCDDICRECYGSEWECHSIESCYPGDGFTGVCMFN